MKITKQDSLDRNELLQIANHLIFMTGLAFVAHQNVLHPEPVRGGVPVVAQALNLQPRTPPPAYDPDQLSGDEIDLTGRPE